MAIKITYKSIDFTHFFPPRKYNIDPPPPQRLYCENKHAHQLQTGLMRYMILKLHGNETRSSCDQRLFFSPGALHLVDAASPRTIYTVKKKYPVEPTVNAC